MDGLPVDVQSMVFEIRSVRSFLGNGGISMLPQELPRKGRLEAFCSMHNMKRRSSVDLM
jgi:hypothetical protein